MKQQQLPLLAFTPAEQAVVECVVNLRKKGAWELADALEKFFRNWQRRQHGNG